MSSAGPNMGVVQEQYLAWQHLANEQLIPGSYSGVGPNYYQCNVGSTNCPAGKAGQDYYLIGWYTSYYVSGYWDVKPANYLMVGLPGTGWPANGFLTVTEAYAIDQKVDDGKPGTGTWMGAFPVYAPSCMIDTATGINPTGSVASQSTSVYNLGAASSARYCAFLIYTGV